MIYRFASRATVMATNKVQEIIERAMRDRTVYDAVAVRESEVGSFAARKPMKNWRERSSES
jgi:hypothetical protein